MGTRRRSRCTLEWEVVPLLAALSLASGAYASCQNETAAIKLSPDGMFRNATPPCPPLAKLYASQSAIVCAAIAAIAAITVQENYTVTTDGGFGILCDFSRCARDHQGNDPADVTCHCVFNNTELWEATCGNMSGQVCQRYGLPPRC